MLRIPSKTVKNKVLAVVNGIPSGEILTYGQVGDNCGLIARTVGWIMASLSQEEILEKNVPWHRVVGAGGSIPALKYGFRGEEQIFRLEKEGWQYKKNRISK